MTAKDGFPQLVRSEWTKFRSVRGTRWSAIAVVVLTVGLSLFGATAFSSSTATECPCPVDQGHFVHQPLRGDGSVTARVLGQQDTGTSPRAGLMMRDGLAPASSYVSIAVVP